MKSRKWQSRLPEANITQPEKLHVLRVSRLWLRYLANNWRLHQAGTHKTSMFVFFIDKVKPMKFGNDAF